MAIARLDPARATQVLLLNLIPLAGVLLLGWDALEILLLYWAEDVVIGLAGLMRVTTARGGGVALAGRLGLGLFFLIHYGMFCLVHGVMVVALTVLPGEGEVDVVGRTLGSSGFMMAVAAMAVLQVVETTRDWWLSGRWRTALPTEEMSRPYGRVLVLHLTVILGAGALTLMGAPAGAIIVLCLAKAGLELFTSARRPDDAVVVDEPLPK